MAVIDVINNQAQKVSELQVSDDVFNVAVKPTVLHEVVTMQLAARRAGSAKVKNRSDISGSTRKLFRQKGTGRARRGNIKSPLLRGGGVVFGPHPKSWGYKVPKKVRKSALKMAISAKFQQEALLVLDDFGLEQIKTKDFKTVLDNLKVDNALIIVDSNDEKLVLSARNVPHVKILKVAGLNVYDILKYQNLVLLAPSVEAIERRLAA